MKPKFIIKRLGAQEKRSINFDVFLTREELDKIAKALISSTDYDIEWIEEKNIGRLIELETDSKKLYINLSQYGEITARNNYFQSVITAYGQFLNASRGAKKPTGFYFYFLPFYGNNLTDYMLFFYRIMKTCKIVFINPEYGFHGHIIEQFYSVKDIIKNRNILRKRNTGNQSTYVTDEGERYHIYGKTFGANQKETTLLCVAIAAIADKEVQLYQIEDNASQTLSSQDIQALNRFVELYETKPFQVMDGSLQFDDGDSDVVRDRLRSPIFIYNLLEKYGGEKHCSLCECKIESIVQAAHIYPVSQIRRNDLLNDEEKFKLAVDRDNGIWLCENHHKLFDRGFIWFENGKLKISSQIDKDDFSFVKKITNNEQICPPYLTERMLAFFDMRAGIPPRTLL